MCVCVCVCVCTTVRPLESDLSKRNVFIFNYMYKLQVNLMIKVNMFIMTVNDALHNNCLNRVVVKAWLL